MFKKTSFPLFFYFFCAFFSFAFQSMAWEHHTLISEPLVESLPEIVNLPDVEVVSFEDFLISMKETLQTVLTEHETWARTNLKSYAPLPESLTFTATGCPADIRERFFEAIRVNPESKTALYLSTLVFDPEEVRTGLSPDEITLLPSAGELRQFHFEGLNSGDSISPVDVLVTASHEPDYGLDVGLFADNGTEYGARYGFGEQPFGDPNLDYGSQAPFHMGYYHESWLVFLFAGFLKQTYPEYRIHLYKTLSETAFEHGQEYWGWRFAGWGLHYIADLSMPYHSTVLPGYSTFRMLLINLLDMLGCPKYVDEAVQLVSNRHAAYERFQGIQFEQLMRMTVKEGAVWNSLQYSGVIPDYNDSFPKEIIACKSHAISRKVNKIVTSSMPNRFVNDPSVESTTQPDFDQIADLVLAEHGEDAIKALNGTLAESLSIFSLYGRSFILSLLPE